MASKDSVKNSNSGEELTARNVEVIAQMDRASNENRNLGARLADQIAAVVGSWPFIICQSFLLALWITLNLLKVIKHWDPYPFILLNLGLSFQAAYASPIIMMSQNRQSRLSERRNHLDLQINLLSEQENTEMLRLLRALCEKAGVGSEELNESRALEEPTEAEKLVQQIDEHVL